MKRRDFIVSAAAFSGLAGCGVFTPRYTFRYRLTLSVNVGGALHSGSTVLKNTWTDAGPLSQMGRWEPDYWGDAIIVSRQASGVLIGMLSGLEGHDGGFSPREDTFISLLGSESYRLSDVERSFKQLEHLQGTHVLPVSQWPLLTLIADVNDIKSAKLINQSEPNPRISIESFTLEMTLDSVSRGIETQVPCLKQVETFRPKIAPPETHPLYELFNKRNFHVDGERI